VECLRKWQRQVVLDQPTHPKYHTKIDSVCNVCLEPFTGVGEPPSRHEQILAYTGAELAALIVSRAFPSYTRSILAEMYLCQACSCHAIEDGNARPGARQPGEPPGQQLDLPARVMADTRSCSDSTNRSSD
jgi:hypothetical protein